MSEVCRVPRISKKGNFILVDVHLKTDGYENKEDTNR